MSLRLLSRSCVRRYNCGVVVPKAYAPIHTSANKPVLQWRPPIQAEERVLESLPLPVLARTLTVLSVAALPSPILKWFIRIIRRHSRFIASSTILQWPLRKTFYDTFCIGQNKAEIAASISTLRSRGISGVVLAFAREAKLDDFVVDTALLEGNPQLQSWVACNLETISQVGPGDYIALKFTGAGPAAVKALEDFNRIKTSTSVIPADKRSKSLAVLENAMFEICAEAEKKGVKVMVDAESSLHQPAIDYLTLESMAAFNSKRKAVVYNTYQMYLTSAKDTLKLHLEDSARRGYVAGIKLVRGAYLYVEPDRKSIIHGTKDATDSSYDKAIDYLLAGESEVESANSKPWTAEVMLATHNSQSVDKAFALFREKRRAPVASQMHHSAVDRGRVQSMVFAQLMGMADEISMKLATEIKQAETAGVMEQGLGIYKYTVWGSFEDCLLYMLRRAEENQDAVARSRVTALVMIKEIGNRLLFWR